MYYRQINYNGNAQAPSLCILLCIIIENLDKKHKLETIIENLNNSFQISLNKN